jgi:L-ascorbate metabolism protein UlaG (beta-lactamase superfamily)
VLIQFGGWRLLTDPTFDAPGQKYNFGWCTGSAKLAGPAVAAADIGQIDAVLRWLPLGVEAEILA